MFMIEGPAELPLEESDRFTGAWRLTKDIAFTIKKGDKEDTIRIFRGFYTDVASVPKGLRWLFPQRNRKYDGAAVLHDYLYVAQAITEKSAEVFGYDDPRLFADEVFYYHVKGWRRWFMWAFVRIFGAEYWAEIASKRVSSREEKPTPLD